MIISLITLVFFNALCIAYYRYVRYTCLHHDVRNRCQLIDSGNGGQVKNGFPKWHKNNQLLTAVPSQKWYNCWHFEMLTFMCQTNLHFSCTRDSRQSPEHLFQNLLTLEGCQLFRQPELVTTVNISDCKKLPGWNIRGLKIPILRLTASSWMTV